MRHLAVIAIALSVTAGATIMSVSPTEIPTDVRTENGTLSVSLERGSAVRFIQDSQKTVGAEVNVGGQQIVSELTDCDLPKSIHVESVKLIRDDLRTDEHRAESFTLLLDVGSEQDRRFGKLPRIQLTWSGGRLVMALVTRQTSPSMAFSSPLCNPDVPNTLPERARDQ